MAAISQTTLSNAFSWNENVIISIKFSLKFVAKGPINNIPALVQIVAWRRPGDKPLSDPVMVSLLTHICVTRHVDGLVHDCSNSSALAMELLQSCTKPSMWNIFSHWLWRPCPTINRKQNHISRFLEPGHQQTRLWFQLPKTIPTLRKD